MFGLLGSRVLSVEAARPVRKGEAISMDYGPDKLDNTLLLDYGVLDTTGAKVGGMVLQEDGGGQGQGEGEGEERGREINIRAAGVPR